MAAEPGAISGKILDWFDRHGRHDLPWQQQATPYTVWVSEIMLQQTQVSTVIPYFNKFIQRFPDVQTLAAAGIDDVLHYWTGLGYYARGRNLHKAAQVICREYDGSVPDDLDALLSLPGIGRSTAGAILSLAYRQRHPILDGNVKRVLTRLYAIEGWPGKSRVEQQLWTLADQLTPHARVDAYTQAIMDLGATVCTRTKPACAICPVAADCRAHQQGTEHRYPQPKPKTRKPVRQAVFMIIENPDAEILLQLRPPAGIWGGLWGFPECDRKSHLKKCLAQMGFRATHTGTLAPFRHTFSHFHLDINLVHCRVIEAPDGIAQGNDTCWVRPGKLPPLGLAAPVKKLLQQLELLHDTHGTLRKAG
ncbi:MAG: A/G-specific adenine glycosylase [Thiotrichales bacterium]|nr:A/G-specific adenine glycosylase [Thiotrichales bacterium]